MKTAPARPARSELDRLVTLIEVSRSLTSELDVQDIIQRILAGAIQVIPAAQAGILFLYDRDRNELVVNHAIGFGPRVYDLAVKPHEGLSGMAFTSRRPGFYPHRAEVMAVMGRAQPANLAAFADASGGTDYPQSALSAPLVYKDEVLGAMVVENLDKPEVFEPFDVRLLDALAQFAAIAIVNARLYAAEHAGRLHLEALNAEIRSQKEVLERRLEVEDALAEVVRDDLPLAALATRLARMTQASVIVADALYRVRATDVASSATSLKDLQRQPWPELEAALRQAARTRAQQRLEADGSVLLVSPVTSGPESLGFILLDARDRRPDAVDAAAADSAALIAAARLLRERAQEEGEIRRRGDLFDRLLSGELPVGSETLRQAQPPLRLVVGTLVPAADVQADSNAWALRSLLALTQEALGRPVITTVKDGHVIAVESLAGRAPEDGRDWRALESAAEHLERLAPAWRAVFAVGDEVAELGALAAAREEARLAIEIRERLGRRERVFKVRSLGAFRLILRAASGAEAVQLCRETLEPVIEHDRKRRSGLLPTFRTYLESGATVKGAAARLGVHPHTVEYRLGRLQELTGLDLRRHEDRLTLELALRVMDIGSPDLGP